MSRLLLLAVLALIELTTIPHAVADGSGPELASYYEQHMALLDGVAYGWTAKGDPRELRSGVRQVGVGKDTWYALLDDGTLQRWNTLEGVPTTLMRGVRSFAAGHSGWFGIDSAGVLWHGSGALPPQRIADDVVAASIGDSADYYITRDGALWVKGLAHRGQYGDGKLTATTAFVTTARDALVVKAHTGHAIHLRRDGVVLGTGGNRYGPLGTHGFGDKADRWGPVFDNAVTIATGSRHSAAIRADGSLWVWGGAFGVAPTKPHEHIAVVAAGDTATIARTVDGTLLQWDESKLPRRIVLRRK